MIKHEWRLLCIWWLHLLLPRRLAFWHIGKLDTETVKALADSDFWPYRTKEPSRDRHPRHHQGP